MLSRRTLLERIDRVEEAAASDGSAYVLRTRIARLTRSLTQAVEREMKAQEGVSQACGGLGDRLLEMASVSRRLEQETKQLVQRSEPFGDLWLASWGRLSNDLRLLRSLLEQGAAVG
jgi:hypothetical protein